MASSTTSDAEVRTKLNPGDFAPIVGGGGDDGGWSNFGYDLGAKLAESVSLLDSGVTTTSAPADIKTAIEGALAPDAATIPGSPVHIVTGDWPLDERAVLPPGARVVLSGTVISNGTDSVTGAVLGLGQMAWNYLTEEWSVHTGGGKGYPGYFDGNGVFLLASVSRWTLTLSDVSPDEGAIVAGDVLQTSGNGMGRVLSVDPQTREVVLYRAVGTFAADQTITQRNGSAFATEPVIEAAAEDGEATYAEQFVAAFGPGDKFLFVADRGYKAEIGGSLGTPPYGSGGTQLIAETLEPLTLTGVTSGSSKTASFEGGVPPCFECDDCWILVLEGIGGIRLDQTLTGGTSGAAGKVVAVNPGPLLSVVLAEVTGAFIAGEKVAGKAIESATKLAEFVYGFVVLANDPAVNEGDPQYHMHLLEDAIVQGSGALVSTEFSPFQKMGAQRLMAQVRSQTGDYGVGGNAVFDSLIRFDYPLAREKLWDIAMHSSRTVYEFVHMSPADWSMVDRWDPGVFNEYSRWVTIRGHSCDMRGRCFDGTVFASYGGSDCTLELAFVDARFGSPTASLIQIGNDSLSEAMLWNAKRSTRRDRYLIRHAKLSQLGRFVFFDTNPEVVDIQDCEIHIGFADGLPSIAAVDCRHGHSADVATPPTRSIIRPRIGGHFRHGDVFLDAAVAPHVEVWLDDGRVAGIPDDCFVLENGLRRYAGAAYRPVDTDADPTLAPSASEGQIGENAYETRYVLAGGGTAKVDAPVGNARDGQTLTINLYNHHASATLTPAWDGVYLGDPGMAAIDPGNRSIFSFAYRSGAWFLAWSVENLLLPGAVVFTHCFDSDRYWNTTQLLPDAAIRDNAFTRLACDLAELEYLAAALPGLRPGAIYSVTCAIADRSAGNITVGLGQNSSPTNFTESGTQQLIAGEEVASSGGRSYQSELRVALGSTTNAGIKLQSIEVREL